MLKLSKMTDYAVIVLADMAGRDGAVVSASCLAASTHLPEPTVSKILKLLGREGIVESVRGANGGYRLTRPPKDITIAGIVSATEGPIALAACIDKKTDCCARTANCSMRGKWEPVNAAMVRALESVSLQQMIGGRG
jgi:FeS assembly SUF system regulator